MNAAGGVLASTRMCWSWLLALEVPTPVERPPTPVVEIEWRGPAECPSGDDVRTAVEAIVGPFGEDPSRRLRVAGVTAREGTAYVLQLEVDTGGAVATRRFEAPRCDELLAPVVVVVALAVDLTAAASSDEPTPEPPPVVSPPIAEPVAPPRDAPPPRTISPKPPTSGPRTRALLGASTGLDVGHLPGVGAALEVELGVVRGRGRAELGVVHLFARDHDRTRGTGGTFAATNAVARGCAELGRRKLLVPICAGIELGSIRASGRGVSDTDEANHLWFALAAGAGVAWVPHPRVAIGARAWLLVAPARRAFSLAGAPLYTTGVVAGRPLVHIEVRLP